MDHIDLNEHSKNQLNSFVFPRPSVKSTMTQENYEKVNTSAPSSDLQESDAKVVTTLPPSPPFETSNTTNGMPLVYLNKHLLDQINEMYVHEP
jgi:hypothetical protein